MMYNHKLVAAIKSNGKILREFGDKVYVPFSSEYSILIKNLNHLRALVDIEVDGKTAVKGLVVDAKSEVELERFVGKNLNKGNKFKFIEKTDKISEHRGNKIDDGIISISYRYEVDWAKFRDNKWIWVQPVPGFDYCGAGWHLGNSLGNTVGNSISDGAPLGAMNCSSTLDSHSVELQSMMSHVTGSADVEVNTSNGILRSSNNRLKSKTRSAVPENESGITVPGSASKQKFKEISGFIPQGEEYTITLNLLGETADNKKVRKAVTTKTKIECETCGTKNKATAKFCGECGTAVHVIA